MNNPSYFLKKFFIKFAIFSTLVFGTQSHGRLLEIWRMHGVRSSYATVEETDAYLPKSIFAWLQFGICANLGHFETSILRLVEIFSNRFQRGAKIYFGTKKIHCYLVVRFLKSELQVYYRTDSCQCCQYLIWMNENEWIIKNIRQLTEKTKYLLVWGLNHLIVKRKDLPDKSSNKNAATKTLS